MQNEHSRISFGHTNVVLLAKCQFKVQVIYHLTAVNCFSLREDPSTASWKQHSDHLRNVLCTASWNCMYSNNDFWLKMGQKEHKSSEKLKMFSADKAVRKSRWVWCNPKKCLKCEDPHWKWDVQCTDRYQTVSSWLSNEQYFPRVFKEKWYYLITEKNIDHSNWTVSRNGLSNKGKQNGSGYVVLWVYVLNSRATLAASPG